jgi:hypothetical protein
MRLTRDKNVAKKLVVPEGWSIKSTKRHYDLFFISTVAFHFLVGLIPHVASPWPPADVSYTLQRETDGTVITVRLDGEHSPDALVDYLRANGAISNS